MYPELKFEPLRRKARGETEVVDRWDVLRAISNGIDSGFENDSEHKAGIYQITDICTKPKYVF